jgi:hypothetical protein
VKNEEILTDLKHEVEYNGQVVATRDLPAPIRHHFGYGHFPEQGDAVIPHPEGKIWPYTPDTCLRADDLSGLWVDSEHLACPGCGLDVT